MGLDTSHDCWHGAYSAFTRWRTKLAEVAGLPPLFMMEGYFSPDEDLWWLNELREIPQGAVKRLCQGLPIKWECLKKDVLCELLNHSDCDGILSAKICGPLANRLEKLLLLLPEDDAGGHIGFWRVKTEQFITGLRRAVVANEDVEFF